MERSTKRDLRNWRSFFRFVQTKNLFRALSSLLLKMENFRKRVEFFPSVVTNRNSIVEEGNFISCSLSIRLRLRMEIIKKH